MDNVSLAAAFAAGLLSFVSPCVLPLIPGYVSFVSGVSVDELRGGAPPAPGHATATVVRRKVLLASVGFVLGFSLVFITLGASATALGRFVLEQLPILARIAGIVLVLFGLHMIGVLRIRRLNTAARMQTIRRPAGMLGATLVGVSFGFGWTPCIGPILAAILAIAAAQDSVGDGVRLLGTYSLGLAVPFLATSLAIDRFFVAFARVRRHFRLIDVTSGGLLVTVGVLIFTGRLTIIAQWLSSYLPVY